MLPADESDGWVGTPSTSPQWIFTMDVYDFHARRGVVMLSPDIPEQVSDERIRREVCEHHLRAAVRLQEELRKQEKLIAAEAISLGISFSTIGHCLDIGKSAAHGAYSGLWKSSTEVSCLSVEWCAGDRVTAVARHLVRQLGFITQVDTPPAVSEPPQERIGVLAYLKSTRLLNKSVGSTMREIVAEMRALGVTWSAIGEILGSNTTATQKKFGAELPRNKRDGEDRRTGLWREKEAAKLLFQEEEREKLAAGHEDIDPPVALNHAVRLMRSAHKDCVEYGNRLKNAFHAGGLDQDYIDDLSWVDRSSNAIAQAVISLLVPGAIDAALIVAQGFDRAIAKERHEYTPMVLYVFFLFSLSFVHVAEVFKIGMARHPGELTEDDADTCVTAAIGGAGVAAIALDIIDKLKMESLFSPGAPVRLLKVLTVTENPTFETRLKIVSLGLVTCPDPDGVVMVSTTALTGSTRSRSLVPHIPRGRVVVLLRRTHHPAGRKAQRRHDRLLGTPRSSTAALPAWMRQGGNR